MRALRKLRTFNMSEHISTHTSKLYLHDQTVTRRQRRLWEPVQLFTEIIQKLCDPLLLNDQSTEPTILT